MLSVCSFQPTGFDCYSNFDFIYTMLCNAMLTFLHNFQFSPAYLVERWLVYKQVMAGSQYCSKMIATRILVLIACFGSLNAALIRRSVGGSKCPVVTTKPDFEIEKVIQEANTLNTGYFNLMPYSILLFSISEYGTKSPNCQTSSREICIVYQPLTLQEVMSLFTRYQYS